MSLNCEASIDLLYFQAREQGTAYALTDETHYPHFNSHLGVRATFGWHSHHDDWTFQLQGLHFHARSNDTLTQSALPTWAHPQRAEDHTASSTLSRWRLHLGWIDLTLARPFCWITPFFGFKFAGIRQKSRIDYMNLGPFAEEDLSMKNKFWGFGPEMGVQEKWFWSSHWGIYARAAGSLLFGRFDLHQDEQDAHHRSLGRMKLLNSFKQTRALAEGALGFCTRYCFKKSALELRAGWEIYLLSGQNLAMQLVDNRAPGFFVSNLGDLTLQGWTLGLLIDF